MTRSRPLKLAALALLVLGLGLGTPVGLAQRTITVCPQGCQYAKIQEAITAASEGDTIQVKCWHLPREPDHHQAPDAPGRRQGQSDHCRALSRS
jgi:hypothetical protein